MEHLLFLLFVLFSVGSALLERRKRARRRAEEAAKRDESAADTSGDEEEPSWFPSTDPFELEPAPDRISADELELQALEAVQRSREAEQYARELEQQAQEPPSRRGVEELVREAVRQKREKPEASARQAKWSISAKEARRGIVYAEILGKPKAERREEF